ncbi:MAG: uroporphyrinogen-III synthase [Acidobacteria bacterium]|nr:uroporphyrinogen-III synthase [Acidobacteriota bacterium]
MILRQSRRSVVVTEADGPGRTLAALLLEAGVDVRMLPVVEHGPAPDPARLETALARLPEYAWAAFTSARAVDAVCLHAAWGRWPWATATQPRIAAVGPVTRAALLSQGVPVALCPQIPGARALAQAMIAAEGGSLAGRVAFWPRSNVAQPDLGDALRAAGAELVAPVAYCTVSVRPANLADVLTDLEAGRIDCVTFLSPSGAAGLAAVMPDRTLSALAGRTLVASVGPTTSAALAGLGAPAGLEAAARTAGGLAASLLSYFGLNERIPS